MLYRAAGVVYGLNVCFDIRRWCVVDTIGAGARYTARYGFLR